MPNVGRKAKGSHTQSATFVKRSWTKAECQRWLRARGMYTDGYDETPERHRWRQYDPEHDRFRYRTKALPGGIALVLGFPKKGKAMPSEERINTGMSERFLTIRQGDIDVENRTVSVSFSSEEPVERYFGWEVLDHKPSSARLERLRAAGPVLVDHDSRQQVGVVERVQIKSKRGEAVLRYGKSARAEQEFQDIRDGIRRNVSFRYRIHSMVLESDEDGDRTYRSEDWEPYEISTVSMPADITVGVGRQAEPTGEPFYTQVLQREEQSMPDEVTPQDATRSHTPSPAPVQPPAPVVDVAREREQERQEERGRVSALLEMGERFDARELASSAIREGHSTEQLRAAIMERWDTNGRQTVSAQTPGAVDIEMSPREQEEYSLLRALRTITDGGERGLEMEVSDTIAKQLGKGTRGVFVPTNLTRGRFDLREFHGRMGLGANSGAAGARALESGVATAGQELVATDLMSLIDILRNRMLVRRMGATVLSGLDGNVAFPRQTGTGTLYWVAETPGSDVAEGDATFDQVTLSPKSAQATTAYSRQLLRQASLDVENFVRNDLALVNALGVDSAAINGTGASNQPTGIRNVTGVAVVAIGANGGAPTWAHIVNLETEVAQDNADVGMLGYLTNAKVRGKLKQTDKGTDTGQFVWGAGRDADGLGEMNGYKAGVSNQVPSNLTKGTSSGICSNITFGNWGDLLIGEWGVIEIITDPYRLKKQALIEVTSFLMVDIAVRHPESFSVVEDALTT